MTKLEVIARALAAELSIQGEDDWGRFIELAQDVGARLQRQFSVSGAFGRTETPRHL